ncbi:MAG: 3-hydroxyacyl-CoA dehydrogenase NAD-binding domain-containing protein [Pseudomonadota bacterium]|nr:3-hydroxyacyl-CoA dehydrogenase NAD-binding domain-containing protein [Pseudomonadota bacterium]
MFEGLRFLHWKTELGTDGVLVISLDRAGEPVNALSRAVLDELEQLLERVDIEPPKGLILRSAKTAGFIAGADIGEFQRFAEKGETMDAIKRGHRVFSKLAALKIPTVAAIHGHCMGGGLEIALACRARIVSDDAKTRLGVPEVKLGIQPGWGGSARLPHLIGAPAAFDLMLTGRSISAAAARALGLVDKVVPAEKLLEEARALLGRRIRKPLLRRWKIAATNWWVSRQLLAPVLRKQVARKADPRHYPAPFAIIEFWRRYGGSVASGLAAEPRSVVKLAQTPAARNLVRVYFLQESLKSLGTAMPHGIQRVHVVGAGVMGGDIAAWCALQGFTVSLQDREMKFIQPALDRARELFARKLKTEDKIAPVLARLQADVESAHVPDADLIIEAIFENRDAKQALYATLEPRMKPGAILATNTSSIPLPELGASLRDPSRFVGIHYFNPVALMPLVEIVQHDKLSPEVAARAAAFVKAIDKLPVPVSTSPGFLVNRILVPYLIEAATIFSEGVPGPVIDRVARKFGMPMGPIELADVVGLDVAASVGKVVGPVVGMTVPTQLQDLLSAGKRGKKDGQGLYTWKDGRAIKPDVPSGYKAPDDLEDRMILPFLNEAVACLHEGVVRSEEHLDAGLIFATGFAPFRGGPIQYIRDTGGAKLKARLEALAVKYGPRFTPKPGWDRFS